MPTDHAASPWAIRSALVAVADLDRSIVFYQEIGPFEEIVREDAVAVLGAASTGAINLILRESRSVHRTRHGQQSLGLRSITFNVGSLAELDRIETVLKAHDLFTSRGEIFESTTELLRGRDPDNMPLVFVCFAGSELVAADYYREILNLAYSLDT